MSYLSIEQEMSTPEGELRVAKRRLDRSLQTVRCFREKGGRWEVSARAVEDIVIEPLRRLIAKIEADIAAGEPTTVHPRVIERQAEKQRDIDFNERAERAAEARRELADVDELEPEIDDDLEDGEPF